MIKSKILNAQTFAKSSENVAFLSHMPLEGFMPASDKGDTDAKPQIWDNWEDFKTKTE